MTHVHSHPHAHAATHPRRHKRRPKVAKALVATTVHDVGPGFKLRSTTIIGNVNGYTSLESAKADLTRVTSGPKVAAAGVFELGGRFYGSRLETVQPEWLGADQYVYSPVDLEGAGGTFVKGIESEDSSLKLVVDGDRTITPADKPDASF